MEYGKIEARWSRTSMKEYLSLLSPMKSTFHQLAKDILATEKKYWDYFAFYHGQSASVTLANDIMNAIYSWLNIENLDEQTKFLRFFTQQQSEYKNVDEVLKISESLKEEAFGLTILLFAENIFLLLI